LLIQTIKHEHEDLKMPKAGAKLDDKSLPTFERWIRDGAADPRDTAPSPKSRSPKKPIGQTILERRKQWWAFLPNLEAACEQNHRRLHRCRTH
jgi:hypothetical protein